MMGRSHEELKQLLVPYALGAIPEDEMVEIRAHILECEECMAEADSFAATASSLAFAAAPEELPSGFADRVIDLVHEERPAVVAPRREPARRWRLVEVFAFAALVGVIGVLSFSLVDARHDVAYDRRVVSALLEVDDGLKLEGSGGRAAVVPAGGDALFVAQGLADAPSDRVYQLWLMHGDCGGSATADTCTIVSAGTFEARDGIAVVRTSKPLDGFENAAVTIEPEGGSDGPTTTPVISSI